MRLEWYFEALAAVVTYAWWYGRAEEGQAWATWIHTAICGLWEKLWTAMMRHLGPVSPYTYQPRHGVSA